MPRVKQVVAAKDYPKFGIVKGQKHYHWKRKTGPRSSQEYRQLTPPRIEQLTGSEYKIACHHISEAIGKVAMPDDLDEVISLVRDLGETQREKYDNMPPGLQEGPTGTTLDEQASALESAADEFEQLKDEWETAISEHDEERTAFEEYESAKDEWDEDSGEPEPEEVEDPGDFDQSEWVDKVTEISYES
jgi:hypothetical protein